MKQDLSVLALLASTAAAAVPFNQRRAPFPTSAGTSIATKSSISIGPFTTAATKSSSSIAPFSTGSTKTRTRPHGTSSISIGPFTRSSSSSSYITTAPIYPTNTYPWPYVTSTECTTEYTTVCPESSTWTSEGSTYTTYWGQTTSTATTTYWSTVTCTEEKCLPPPTSVPTVPVTTWWESTETTWYPETSTYTSGETWSTEITSVPSTGVSTIWTTIPPAVTTPLTTYGVTTETTWYPETSVETWGTTPATTIVSIPSTIYSTIWTTITPLPSHPWGPPPQGQTTDLECPPPSTVTVTYTCTDCVPTGPATTPNSPPATYPGTTPATYPETTPATYPPGTTPATSTGTWGHGGGSPPSPATTAPPAYVAGAGALQTPAALFAGALALAALF